jgi:hypothetical protein
MGLGEYLGESTRLAAACHIFPGVLKVGPQPFLVLSRALSAFGPTLSIMVGLTSSRCQIAPGESLKYL